MSGVLSITNNVAERFGGIRRSHILENRTVCAYLPVRFEASYTGKENCISLQYKQNLRINNLMTIHENISFSLKNIRQTALVYLACGIVDDHGMCFNLMVSFYIADIP